MIYPTGNMWMVHQEFQGITHKCNSMSQFSIIVLSFYSLNQVRTMLEEKQYAIQIKEALELIKESKESVKEHKVKYDARKESYERSKLKHKGKMRLL